MRNIIIATLILFVNTMAFAQEYTAIHVIGKIYMPDKKAYMQRGDKVSETEKLQFQSDDAKAAMLSSSKGRYVIQPSDVGGGKADNNLTFALKSIITPAKGQMSTRAGGINNKLDFQKQFGDSPVAWINETLTIEVSPSAYPVDEVRFFYVSYTYKGEAINKVTRYAQGAINIDKSSLYSIDGKSINPAEATNMEIYYYDENTEEADFMSALNLVPVSTTEVASMLSSIPADIKGDERVQTLYDYINSLYGRCDMKTVSKIINDLK